MKQILLIGGKARSGKDSTATFLKQKLNGNSLILHMADYLKFVYSYTGWDGIKDEKSRTELQKLGGERVRIELNKPLYWVERVCDVIEIYQNNYDYFLVPDLRYANEIFFPQARFPGFVTTIRITRPNFDNGLLPEQKWHRSETELDDFKFNYYITSESGLDKLETEVDKFLIEYNKKFILS
jgi:hypothetical protein